MSENARRALPKWFRHLAILGLAWNIFGIIQFLPTVQGSVGSLMGKGMTKEQAELYVSLPAWMTLAFATGVFGGALGCLLMLVRSPWSRPVFAASLAAYLVLYVGDITQGVFQAFGVGQVAILTTVVLIAAGLLWVSMRQFRRTSG
jgi:hypothetical protein